MGKLTWLDLIRPHLTAYSGLARGQREAFARDLATRLDLVLNTVQRQLLAAQFLRERGLDDIQAPLMSVEAVARAGRYNRRLELELLEELARGDKPIAYFRERAEAAFDRRSSMLSVGEAQAAKAISVHDAVDHLRTLSGAHLAPLRQKLVVNGHEIGHPAGLLGQLRTTTQQSVSVFAFPFQRFAKLSFADASHVEHQLSMSITRDLFTLAFCAFEFEPIQHITAALNERNRPYFYVFNGVLSDTREFELGKTF